MNKIIEILLIAPHTYMIIELIFIELKCGLDALNNFSNISAFFIILLVVLIPCLCSLFMYSLVNKFTKGEQHE